MQVVPRRFRQNAARVEVSFEVVSALRCSAQQRASSYIWRWSAAVCCCR